MKVFGDLPSSYKRKKGNISTDNLQRYFKKPSNAKASPRGADSSTSDTYSWSPLSSSRSADGSLSSHALNVSCSDNDINFYRLPSGDVEHGSGGKRRPSLGPACEDASSHSVEDTEKEGDEMTVVLKASYDSEKVKKDVYSNNVWTKATQEKAAYRIAFRLLEAKKIPVKDGHYFVVKLRSADPNFPEVEWTTPLTYGTSRVHFSRNPAITSTLSLEGLTLHIQMYKMHKVPKLVSEESALLSVFPVDGVISKEIHLHKDVIASLQLTIVSVPMLANEEYQPFVLSLLEDNMKITQRLLIAIGENQLPLASLINILTKVNAAGHLLDRVLCLELNSCDSVNCLFRQDNLNTSVLDTYLHIVGHEYLIQVLKPFVQQVMRERPSCEIEGASKEDLTRNLQTMTALMNKLLDIITTSDDYCPPAFIIVLQKVYSFSMKKWPRNLDGWVTAVTSFLFLRFFVPALLHPCEYELCEAWELRFQEKTTLFNLGIILQKIANLGMFQEGLNNFHLMNTSIQLGSFIIYQWVTAICHTDPKKIEPPSERISDTLAFNGTSLARFCLDNPQSFLRLGTEGNAFLDLVQDVVRKTEPETEEEEDTVSPMEEK